MKRARIYVALVAAIAALILILLVRKGMLSDSPGTGPKRQSWSKNAGAKDGDTAQDAPSKPEAAEGALAAPMREASAAFKEKGNSDRRELARRLLPAIKKGLQRDQVSGILGSPDKQMENGQVWTYVLWYSSYLSVEFDADGRVVGTSMK